MGSALTLALGSFASSLRYDDIPAHFLAIIRTAFVDCVGVMVAGAREPATVLLKSTLPVAGGEATVLHSGDRSSAPVAAWINGTAAHVLDFDDVDGALRGHPSAVLVPAVLAEGEAIGASGREMMLAYAVGHQAWADLARRDSDLHHNKGWHPTGIFGAIAAAAACASLHRLNAREAAQAIGLGASQSAGLVANLGTMTKPFHAGRAAHAGVLSARLVKKGFTAAPDALERSPGFLAAISPAGRFDADSPCQAGREWRSRFAVKKYPVCYCAHRAIDGVLNITKSEKLDANSVERVVVTTSRRNAAFLRYHDPLNGLEAKFSMEFAVASGLIAHRVGLTELTDAFVRRPDVQSLMKRVTVVPDDREDPKLLGYALFDRVVIETRDARRLDSGPITGVRGDADSPLQPEELWEKFEGCMNRGAIDSDPRQLFEMLIALDTITRAQQLLELRETRGRAH